MSKTTNSVIHRRREAMDDKASYAPVRISPDTMREVKVYADEAQMSLTSTVNLMLREAVAARKKRK